ncbi:hypothetical protein JL721_6782 [Aureococcus anophagefferens]|nr:hypothetical protein JL721_6782 [Aureococcus anophagefferens]
MMFSSLQRFKEFCKKMERVAKQHHYDLEYDAERIATFFAGQASMSWKSVMNLVRSDDRFYEETDENGEPKPAGWQFLQADDGDGEEGDEEDDGDEDYDDDDEGEEDDEDEDEDDEDDDDEEEDEDDEEEDDDEDDDAMDW